MTLLHPRFFAAPPGIEIKSGDRFEVLWHARVDNWTLVHWRWGEAGVTPLRPQTAIAQGTEGESLYQDMALIAWDWYELELGDPTPTKARVAFLSPDPRSRIDRAMGRYGLSPAVAAKLRSPEYRITFQG